MQVYKTARSGSSNVPSQSSLGEKTWSGTGIPQVHHGEIGIGKNTTYLKVASEIRLQLRPSQLKNYDNVMKKNINSYKGEIPAYRQFVQH